MGEFPGDRLDGWKAISSYVGRSERAAQRWHAERGMPVHRVPGGRGGAVYALRGEIDNWLQSPSARDAASEHGEDRDSPPHRPGRLTLVALAGVAVVAIAAVAWFSYARGAGPGAVPAKAGLAASRLTAWDASGAVLWTRDISPMTRPEPEMDGLATQHPRLPWVQVPIIEGKDGGREILVVASDSRVRMRPAPQELQAYTERGQRLWGYLPDNSFTFRTRRFTRPWVFIDARLVEGGGARAVWASLLHSEWWPSFLVKLDDVGHPTLQFVNSGCLYKLEVIARPDGRPLVLAGGINNEYGAAALAVLDPDGRPATSPQTPGSPYACDDCPTGLPLRYVVFPRSEVAMADERIAYNRVLDVTPQGTSALVVTVEQASNSATLRWELSSQLDVDGVVMSDGYVEAHRTLEREGRLTHTFENCPERLRGLRVRLWDPATGWREHRVPAVRW